MAKSLTKLSQWMARVRERPLARTERFEVTFEFPNSMRAQVDKLTDKINKGRPSTDASGPLAFGDSPSGEATIMCEEVQIPGMVLQNKEVPIGPWNFMRNSNVNFLGNEINITFLTDHDWYLRHVFEVWIDHCVGSTSKEVAFPDDQFGTVTIVALDQLDNVRTQWKLYEVTPKVLNLVPLAYAGVSIARTTLIISSAYWTSKAINVAMANDANQQSSD